MSKEKQDNAAIFRNNKVVVDIVSILLDFDNFESKLFVASAMPMVYRKRNSLMKEKTSKTYKFLCIIILKG